MAMAELEVPKSMAQYMVGGLGREARWTSRGAILLSGGPKNPAVKSQVAPANADKKQISPADAVGAGTGRVA